MIAVAATCGNRSHKHNGQSKHTKAKKTNKPKKKSKPPLIIQAGDEKPKTLHPANLEQNDWDELREYCDDANGKVTFSISRYPDWPAEARFNFLEIVRDLGKRSRLFVNDVEHGDLFEAVLASMVGTERLDAYKKGFDAACEAASFLYGEIADAAAARINQRLEQLDAPKPRVQSLAKIIRDAAGGCTAEGDALSPEGTAKQFLDFVTGDDAYTSLLYFQGDFYLWKGNHWERQDDDQFQALVMSFLQTRGIPKLTERFAKDVIAHLKGLRLLDCRKESMPFWIKEDKPAVIEKVNCIVLQDRIINVDEIAAGQPLIDYDVEQYFFNETVLPYSFDENAACPLWLDTLNQILPTTGDGDKRREVLQEFFGYTLLNDCRFQKFLVLIGDGGNGKSTVTETWQRMLGIENCSAVALETLGDDYRQISLKGKLANFSGELNYLNKINEGTLKRLVSGEPIDVNRKHKDPIAMRLHAKLIVNTNQLPQINDPTPAMFDRMITIPFEVRVRGMATEDKLRAKKLNAELPGILLWAIAGLKRLINQDCFTICTSCAGVSEKHQHESNNVLTFLRRCCEMNSDMMTASKPLYQIYRVFTEATGRKPVADTEFGSRMRRAGLQFGFKKVRGRHIHGGRDPAYRGIKLSPEGNEYANHLNFKHQRERYSYPVCGIEHEEDDMP